MNETVLAIGLISELVLFVALVLLVAAPLRDSTLWLVQSLTCLALAFFPVALIAHVTGMI